MTRAVMWFRRDLRLDDHPALLRALDDADEVLPLVILDPRLLRPNLPTRRYLASVAALRDQLDGALVVRTGRVGDELAAVIAETGATSVHISGESTPFGRKRDATIGQRLADLGVDLVTTGTPYAVSPGRVRSKDGGGFQVFTPFYRGWLDHGWRQPPGAPGDDENWVTGIASDWSEFRGPADAALAEFTDAGERGALVNWRQFLDHHLRDYNVLRDRPDLPASSRASIPLKVGELHPRTMLADVADHEDSDTAGAHAFVRQLCWRDFYADVLWHRPDSDWHDLTTALDGMPYADEEQSADLIEAWKQGRTGYPFVDAGMRQLLTEGWMHNRVRMVCGSFLAKDLHVWWPIGARHYMEYLIDADMSSNAQGWQWVAGSGTDGAPYFRIFNPVSQGLGFDPDGDFVRRYVPELRHIDGPAVHEPWRILDGYTQGYPERIVDHDKERRIALSQYNALHAD